MSTLPSKLQDAVIITNSSIRVTKRETRSWQTWMLHALLRCFRRHLGRPITQRPKGSISLKPPLSVRRKCHVEERRVHDVYVYDLRLKDESRCYQLDDGGGEKSRRRRKQRIYWFAGGGWQMPADTSHWKFLMALLHKLPAGTTASLVSYPLAPKNPAPTTFPQLMKLYHTVLSDAAAADESVTLAGDSSGGEIVLCLTLEALTQDLHGPKPSSVLAICPSTDLTRANPIIKSIEKHDPILKLNFVRRTAAAWAGEWDKADPRLSPLHSSHLDVFAKAGVSVDGCTAGYDVLGPDGVLFRTKLARSGVRGEWLDWDRMMHVWPLIKVYGICPESEEAFLWIADLLRRRGDGVGAGDEVGDGAVLEGVSCSGGIEDGVMKKI